MAKCAVTTQRKLQGLGEFAGLRVTLRSDF